MERLCSYSYIGPKTGCLNRARRRTRTRPRYLERLKSFEHEDETANELIGSLEVKISEDPPTAR